MYGEYIAIWTVFDINVCYVEVIDIIDIVHTVFSSGADITDYFNYGFTEDTWKQYCEKQRRLRMDLNMPKKNFVVRCQLIFLTNRLYPSLCMRTDSTIDK